LALCFLKSSLHSNSSVVAEKPQGHMVTGPVSPGSGLRVHQLSPHEEQAAPVKCQAVQPSTMYVG
jgi:hypothetical protein